LEIGGLAAIDIDNHIAFHLEAVQTLNIDEQREVITECVKDVFTKIKDNSK